MLVNPEILKMYGCVKTSYMSDYGAYTLSVQFQEEKKYKDRPINQVTTKLKPIEGPKKHTQATHTHTHSNLMYIKRYKTCLMQRVR